MRWRAMTAADLAGVKALADRAHPALPEDAGIFAERLALYPAGSFALIGADGALLGYLVSHPWRYAQPPQLNTRLGAIPALADSYCIHDLALLPQARGAGAGSRIVARIAAMAAAEGFDTLSLVAVNGSAAFWGRCGFEAADAPGLGEKLASYGPDAMFMARDTER